MSAKSKTANYLMPWAWPSLVGNYFKQYPSQIKYQVGNEAAERYSFYGMRSILTLFMVNSLLMAKEESTEIYHLFVAACYLMPLAGAYISDRFWGKYRTIMVLSFFYCLGHAALAIWENKMGLYLGLSLIAIGSGGIKPCASAFVGDQFKPDQEKQLTSVYNLWYWMINFGSAFSSILTPWTMDLFGSSVAFAIPGVLMFIATVIFWLGRKQYVNVPPAGKNKDGIGEVLCSALMPNRDLKNNGVVFSFLKSLSAMFTYAILFFVSFFFWPLSKWFINRASSNHSKKSIEATLAAFDVSRILFTVSIFWALFDQHGSTWVLQAKDMDLNFMGHQFNPAQMQAWNPMMVMGLIPLFSILIYPFLNKFFPMTPLRRMGWGMALAAFSFAQVGFIQQILDGGEKLNVMWQFFPYLTLTSAEIMVSITGLEFAYTQAPRIMKSTIMSMWMLTVFFGNILTAYIARVNVFHGSSYFYFFAGLMLAVSLLFGIVAMTYKMKNFMEKGAA